MRRSFPVAERTKTQSMNHGASAARYPRIDYRLLISQLSYEEADVQEVHVAVLVDICFELEIAVSQQRDERRDV